MSHTYETQEICFFLADVQIILVSLFEFFDCIKVAKNAGAFLSRCSELLGYRDLRTKNASKVLSLKSKIFGPGTLSSWVLLMTEPSGYWTKKVGY